MQLFSIAVTSRLDAVVASTNVLHPMENQWNLACAVVKVYRICLFCDHH